MKFYVAARGCVAAVARGFLAAVFKSLRTARFSGGVRRELALTGASLAGARPAIAAAVAALAALALAGCAHNPEQLSKSAFETPQMAARWCFDALAAGQDAEFYERCVAKLAKGSAGQIRRARWEKLVRAAAEKIGLAGGVYKSSVKCGQQGTIALCLIDYELVSGGGVKQLQMPMQLAYPDGWQIIR